MRRIHGKPPWNTLTASAGLSSVREQMKSVVTKVMCKCGSVLNRKHGNHSYGRTCHLVPSLYTQLGKRTAKCATSVDKRNRYEHEMPQFPPLEFLISIVAIISKPPTSKMDGNSKLTCLYKQKVYIKSFWWVLKDRSKQDYMHGEGQPVEGLLRYLGWFNSEKIYLYLKTKQTKRYPSFQTKAAVKCA